MNDRKPYFCEKQRRIMHMEGPVSFGWEGYLNMFVTDPDKEQMDEHSRILLSVWSWDRNMMNVYIDNPNYDPDREENEDDPFDCILNPEHLSGKSMLPTELRDSIFKYLYREGLIESNGDVKKEYIVKHGGSMRVDIDVDRIVNS